MVCVKVFGFAAGQIITGWRVLAEEEPAGISRRQPTKILGISL